MAEILTKARARNVFYGGSLFFAGVTSSLCSPTLRTALLVTCGVILLVSFLRLAELPIAAATWSIFDMS